MALASRPRRVLVVGGDSTIGAALCQDLQASGADFSATTRRREPEPTRWDRSIHLDLEEDLRQWRYPADTDVAVICAGITKLDECRCDPAGTALINVQGVGAIADRLLADGVFVIYLSTNQVFDGSIPRCASDAPINPITEYGRQKALVEQRLQRAGTDASIVRLSKVFEPRVPLFERWLSALRVRQAIRPFVDMSISPVPLSCAISVLRRVIDVRLSGIVQVSGDTDVTYAEAAGVAADVCDRDSSLVQPTRALDAGWPEPVPRFTSLDVDRLRRELGIQPPDVWWTIKSALSTSNSAEIERRLASETAG